MDNNKPLHQIRLGSVDWRKTRDFFGGSLQQGNFFLGHRSDVCHAPGPHAVPCLRVLGLWWAGWAAGAFPNEPLQGARALIH